MVQRRKTSEEHDCFWRIFRGGSGSLGCREADPSVPQGPGRRPGAGRKVFLLWPITATLVTSCYCDHVFQDLNAATLWESWGSGAQNRNLGADTVQLRASFHRVVAGAGLAISRVSLRSPMPRACHSLAMTIRRVSEHASRRGTDTLGLPSEEGVGDSRRDSMLPSRSKK